MKKNLDKFLQTTLVLSLALSCLTLGLHLIDDYDFLWHLKTGEMIVKQGPPLVDFYSFRAEGREWIDAQWLFQVIIYLVYRFSGFAGESFLLAVLVCAIFLLLLKLCWLKEFYPLSIFLCLIAVWSVSFRFNLRPELFTYLLMMAYLLILERNRKQFTLAIYLLPFLQLLWANLEGLWPIGLVLIGAYGIEEFLFNYLSRYKQLSKWLEPGSWQKFGKILFVFFLCTLMSMVTPYLWRGFIFPFHLLIEVTHPSNLVKSIILDNKPVFPMWFKFPFLAVPLLVLLIVSGASFFLNRKPRPAFIMLWLAFLFISLSARRNVPYICFLAVFISCFNFQNSLASRFSSSDSPDKSVLKFLPAIFSFVLLIFFIASVLTGKFYVWDKTARKFGTGFYFEKYPKDAVEFLKKIGWKDRLYNQLAMGGFLIWEGYPEWRIYIDGRLEVYGDELLKLSLDSMADYDLFKEDEQKYGFTAVLVWKGERRVIPLTENLLADPTWALVFSDPISMVFLKDTPAQHQLVEQYRLNRVRSIP